MKPAEFQKLLFKWFDQHGRKTLPWQLEKNPYRVWLSEIMLQQTQVTTVIPYFSRFLERFPTLEDLAAGSIDEVLHLWTGLGYYSRARNLHKAAKMVCDTYQGRFPDNLEDLQTLPGVGRSTAGAILSIAFQKPATILDGNVKRVLTRLFGIQQWPGEKKVHDQLWRLAEEYSPIKRTADYTQAIMDLGATLCTRGQPQCERCPFKTKCIAREAGIEKKLPVSKPKKALPVRKTQFLIIRKDSRILLEKRPATGIWGGLWSLPEISEALSEDELTRFCRKNYTLIKIQPLAGFRHTFSHFHLDIKPVIVDVKKSKTVADKEQIWYNLLEPATIGLPGPVKKLLEKVGHNND